jgi:hypothetical protein
LFDLSFQQCRLGKELGHAMQTLLSLGGGGGKLSSSRFCCPLD